MRRDDFNVMLAEMHTEELRVSDTKGNEYASHADALVNFKEAGQFLHMSPLQVCLVYMFKHWKSITSYVEQEGRTLSEEPIAGRVGDLRLYAALLLALADEELKPIVFASDSEFAELEADRVVISDVVVALIDVLNKHGDLRVRVRFDSGDPGVFTVLPADMQVEDGEVIINSRFRQWRRSR